MTADLLSTPLTRALGVEVPIIQAPVGSATTPRLAAAVADAGGVGMLSLTWTDAAGAASRITAAQELTDKPFGVNIGLTFDIRPQLDVALSAGVRVVSTFWGDPARVHGLIADAGAMHLHTVGSSNEARQAVESGVDVVVAQGWESGGHVWGEVATMALVPAVVDAVAPVPVVAAGGIADGRGLAAALMLGAQAVWMGTRFLTAEEANTHDHYRHRLVGASAEQAAYTTCFDGGWPGAPHRVLRNQALIRWEEAGRPPSPARPAEASIVARDSHGHEYRLYDDMMPLADHTGDLDEMALYAGQSVELVHAVAPAAMIIREVYEQAQSLLSQRCV